MQPNDSLPSHSSSRLVDRGPLIALFAGFGAVCCLGLVSLAGLAVAAQSALRAGSSNTPTPAATHTRARPTEPSPTPRPTEAPAPTLTPLPTLTPTPAFAFVAFLYANAGTGPWQFEDARSIAVDGAGYLYVGEYTGGRIQQLDPNGLYVTEWNTGSDSPLRGLDADPEGRVYAVQEGNINIFAGDTGRRVGRFRSSATDTYDDLAPLPDGNWLVFAYRNRDDLVRLSPAGEVTRRLAGAVSGQTGNPELSIRVAADAQGNWYALGRFNKVVFKFTPDGQLAQQFGGAGDGPGQFQSPYAIAVDHYGRVFVADGRSIHVFDSGGNYLDMIPVDGVALGMTFTPANELLIAARDRVMKLIVQAPPPTPTP